MVWMIWSSLFFCLSAWVIYFKICKTFAKLLFDMPKSYQSHITIQFENLIHICCLSCIELCQIVVTLERNFCHAFMIKIHVHTIYPLLCFYKKLALYHPSILQNKCSTVCVGLSLSLSSYCKKNEAWVIKKKDPWRSMGPWKKEEKKRKRPLKVLKKKREKNR